MYKGFWGSGNLAAVGLGRWAVVHGGNSHTSGSGAQGKALGLAQDQGLDVALLNGCGERRVQPYDIYICIYICIHVYD